jgi:hypothetical protein
MVDRQKSRRSIPTHTSLELSLWRWQRSDVTSAKKDQPHKESALAGSTNLPQLLEAEDGDLILE